MISHVVPDAERLKALCPEPENYSEAGLTAIRSIAHLDAETLDSQELSDRIDAYDLLFVRLKTFIDADLLRTAHNMKAIISPTTGLNHIDLKSAAARGIKVFHLRGELDFLRTITSTAEHTWALLLALVRHIPVAASDVHAGHWLQDAHRGTELRGKRLGILGFGRLGRIVAEYGHAFGMQVLTYDIKPTEIPDYVTVCNSMGELFGSSDILSVHIPLNDDTEGLIRNEMLSKLPAGAFLLNTSRGEIVDDKAIIKALEEGGLAGAALDVVTNEASYSTSDLIAYARDHTNLLITPHIGGATFEAVEKTDLFVIGQLVTWLREQE
jgi:D-3-phosphoglycerate dehydrogenase